MSRLIYFSSVSENTRRFIDRLGLPAQRLPLRPSDPQVMATEPFVLVVPTYGGGDTKGAVPKQVIKFLNVKANRDLLRGVIAGGNTNFGTGYGLAGDIIAAKCHVPVLYRFELMGTDDDLQVIREGLERFWQLSPRQHTPGRVA
ncbi:class Ib ribonucleoside-diphosphate reductase assembly flavoprotein NrdI [Pseudoclavibacter soli]|uniref:class Ib ribonucleoside-diphosphate reductase assembly flavoprotein NrdI n=1 Tax=Pseudoclavibacter soli TaxID=452623 RepID=UPI0004124FED|nr:class Ib ribonucleoside-diphosphate reductase assembly flavoprotein NrdI [Pseudoclavibacter soli]